MKRFFVAAAALSTLVATPALARDRTNISFEFYSAAPVYYEPAPVYYAPPVVYYYPPVQQVYYAPPRHYGWGHGHRRHHHWRGHDYARNDYDGDHHWRH